MPSASLTVIRPSPLSSSCASTISTAAHEQHTENSAGAFPGTQKFRLRNSEAGDSQPTKSHPDGRSGAGLGSSRRALRSKVASTRTTASSSFSCTSTGHSPSRHAVSTWALSSASASAPVQI
eukprot:1599563-Prymnesium_polylepis.1